MAGIAQAAIEAAQMEPAPITAAWIIAGEPQARCAELCRSRDGTAATFVWDCTAGEFDWTFAADETVHILQGEVVIDDGAGPRPLRPGDVALFHAGSTCRWRVPAYVKKLAFLRDPIPRPALAAIRGWRKLKRLARPAARAPAATLAGTTGVGAAAAPLQASSSMSQ
jgi:uncharacterized cupin superfamily protein